MLALKRRLLSTTFLPLMVSMGVVLATGSLSDLSAAGENPCAAKKPVAGKASPCAIGAAAPCNPGAATGAASDRTYTIRQGDSLADVAQRTYGERSLYRMLADYNDIADPGLILVGQVIRIPAYPGAAQKTTAAASPCNPCNPCAAANPCNPCNPGAAQGMAGASDCVVPRLRTAAAQNPCVATKTANPCNPCAAKNPCAAANPCNPCNPCAPAEALELTPAEASAAYECIKGVMKAAYTGGVKQAAAGGLCNPCAATKAANPCNPCAAAKAANPCNPCAATKIVNPCNPCAATKPANPCNPCAATKAANPCNPCAATKAANPCNPCAVTKPLNPCAASPCNPCAAKNPCKPGAANTPCNPAIIQAALTSDVGTIAREYQGWERLNTAPYVSATHGGRYVNNYPGPEAAAAYAKFEEIGTMPAGGRIARTASRSRRTAA